MRQYNPYIMSTVQLKMTSFFIYGNYISSKSMI